MQTILITGANGFLGYYLTQQLLSKGYTVIATGKGNSRLPFHNTNLIYAGMDFTDEEAVQTVLQQYKPDTIVHAGAISKPDDCENDLTFAYVTNVTGTIHLLNAAQRLQSFFIFLSTDFIFSGAEGMYKEDDEAAPVNYYGQTKWLAEQAVKQYPYPWSIVRTVLVYGKPIASRENLLTVAASNLKAGKDLKIFNDQVRTPTYVEDLAAGLVKIIAQQATGIYHISGEDVLTPYDMACAVADYLGLDKSKIEPVTEDSFHQPARRPLKTGFIIIKARQALNFKPTSFKEGLKKTFGK